MIILPEPLSSRAKSRDLVFPSAIDFQNRHSHYPVPRFWPVVPEVQIFDAPIGPWTIVEVPRFQRRVSVPRTNSGFDSESRAARTLFKKMDLRRSCFPLFGPREKPVLSEHRDSIGQGSRKWDISHCNIFHHFQMSDVK